MTGQRAGRQQTMQSFLGHRRNCIVKKDQTRCEGGESSREKQQGQNRGRNFSQSLEKGNTA